MRAYLITNLNFFKLGFIHKFGAETVFNQNRLQARNFFTMKFIALAIAFSINFMLLFYKVLRRRRQILLFPI
jgi:hypothetical protein